MTSRHCFFSSALIFALIFYNEFLSEKTVKVQKKAPVSQTRIQALSSYNSGNFDKALSFLNRPLPLIF